MPSYKETRQYIKSLTKLGEGWRYGQGKAPSEVDARIMTSLLLFARLLGFKVFEAFPGAEGEIQLAIHDGDHFYAITIEPDATFTVMHEEREEQVLFQEYMGFHDVTAILQEFAFELCDDPACRDVVQIKRHGEFDVFIGARGICYSSLNSFHRREGSERDVFIRMCANLNLEWIADEADPLRAENERLREISERNEVAAVQMSTLIRNCMVLLCGNDYERESTFAQFEITIETLTRYDGPNLQRKMIRREAVRAALVQLRAEIEAESDKFDSGLESWPYDHCRQKLDATIARLGLGAEGE